MTSRDFCYWLQGYFEIYTAGGITGPALSADQTDAVRRHLALVFKHEIDPSAGTPEHQKVLNEIHQTAASGQSKPPPMPPQIGGVGPGGTLYRC